MKISRFFALTLLPLFARVALAQDMPDGDTAAPAMTTGEGTTSSAASRVVQVDAASLAGLPALLNRAARPAAISLRLSQEEFEADANAKNALLAYVRGGGTVFLHTGAARAFGFQTVAARLGTNALSGQLYGRARAALPFGAHPLLWDDGRAAPNRAPGADPTRLPGVNVVFYEMQEGDHLVLSHPAGTPLLQATDLAAGVGSALYAAALAPFGRGLAVFTPDLIDQNRGDGALFARNLLKVIGMGSPAQNGAPGARLVAIPASAVQNGGRAPAALQKALVLAGAGTSSPALPAFGTVPMGPGQTATRILNQMTPPPGELDAQGREDAQNANDVLNANAPAGGAAAAIEASPADAVMFLSSAEASAYGSLIMAGDERASAAINFLRARLFLSRGDARNASRALEAGAALAPNSAETALWRGILGAGAAQPVNQPSPVRARLLEGAARDLALSVGSPSILSGNANPGGTGAARMGLPRGAATGNGAGSGELAGIPASVLRGWSGKLGQISRIFDLEPPLVQRYGVGEGAITVRAAANDPSRLLIVPGAQALANARNFGWHGDNEEILLFPTAQSYLNYRRALGLTAPTVPLPAGAVGDVVGQRISMVALADTLNSTRDPYTGLTTVTPGANSAANVLSRLHSYVLLGAYDEGARSPAWLQLGLENLINIAVVGNAQLLNNTIILDQTAQAGGLLSLEQFGVGLFNGRPSQMMVAQAQSASLMDFFYRTYGAGAVTETVQRLGMGQSIDDVLQATTGNDQLALFRDWRQNRFGPRTMIQPVQPGIMR